MWELVVGHLASICTVAVWLTCVPVCSQILKKGSTTDISFFPYVIMFCNAVLWVKYGLLKGDSTLIYVNGIGAILTLVYIIIYYTYTSTKVLVHKQLALGGILVFPMLLYLRYFAEDRANALLYMGTFCSVMGVVSYGSPLSAVVDVIKSRSTQCMAFGLSFGNFIVALQWTLYGYLIDDLYVQIPNFLGAFLGLVQLSLFVKYPSNPSTTDSRPIKM